MKTQLSFGVMLISIIVGNFSTAVGGTYYVSTNGANVAPFDSWTNAARAIQSAIDIAANGDYILIGPGVYTGEGNRDIDFHGKAIRVESQSGASATILDIQGTQSEPHRAFRFSHQESNEAQIRGLTMIHGYGPKDVLTNDGELYWYVGGAIYCVSSSPRIVECVFSNNYAEYGSAIQLWDQSHAQIERCRVIGNRAQSWGSAIYIYKYCNAFVSNCIVAYNKGCGIGIDFGCSVMLANSLIHHQTNVLEGGGISIGNSHCRIFNCTITENYAASGGGLDTWYCYSQPRIENCIFWGNTPSEAQISGTTTALVFSSCIQNGYIGTSVLTNDPRFVNASAGDYHLLPNSPCINAGTNKDWMASATDLEGRSRIIDDVVDMGCYELPQENPDDSPVHYVSLSGGNRWPYTNWVDAASVIQRAVDSASDGDVVLVTNGTYDTGGRAVYGVMTNRVVVDKSITVQSVNGPDVTFIVGKASPLNEGGIGAGTGAVRCVYLCDAAKLIGFSLTNGHILFSGTLDSAYGAGVYCESRNATISNCILRANYADFGGGAYRGTLINCAIIGNTTYNWGGGTCDSALRSCVVSGNKNLYSGCGGICRGKAINCLIRNNSAGWAGGAYQSILRNCTVVGNEGRSHEGGGTIDCSLQNCIVYYNIARTGANWYVSSGPTNISYTCTVPASSGMGNITNAPLFGGNYHLQAGSPCIDAGNNVYMPLGTDLNSVPRPLDGNTDGAALVDMGCYEFVNPAADSDDDHFCDRDELLAGTDPTDCNSSLRVYAPESKATATGIVVRWQSVASKRYRLDRSTNLLSVPEFNYTVKTNIFGCPPMNSETDTTAIGRGPYFYRIEVEP